MSTLHPPCTLLHPSFIPAQGAIHQHINVCLDACVTRHGQDLATLGGNIRGKLIQPIFASGVDHPTAAPARASVEAVVFRYRSAPRLLWPSYLKEVYLWMALILLNGIGAGCAGSCLAGSTVLRFYAVFFESAVEGHPVYVQESGRGGPVAPGHSKGLEELLFLGREAVAGLVRLAEVTDDPLIVNDDLSLVRIVENRLHQLRRSTKEIVAFSHDALLHRRSFLDGGPRHPFPEGRPPKMVCRIPRVDLIRHPYDTFRRII